ncbi:hypothetical protein HAZT_HAZT000150 [Hyalella azteca]|uniref:Thioredoxin domain-containing protein n=1 Tax=Hyalella azteca TaxID=294128 RepID=A0A6A0H0L7_HYAAZ|nr:hypothetical protein HAZT_HAZT000150 [Hyalella azteca]
MVLSELENIDDECDNYGIHMVKIQDPQLAKRYGIKTLPALIYFRNGNPLIFEGDISIESSVYEWLIDEDNRELFGKVESVNRNMLLKMLDSNPFVAVVFTSDVKSGTYLLNWLADEENRELVDEIEHVNQAMLDQLLEKSIYLAALFSHFSRIGDARNEEILLEWLVDEDSRELVGEIESINAKMLKKMLDETPFIAVFFYDDDCVDCEQVLRELENIDEQVDQFGIDFVKINDPEAAQRFNVLHTPALVYFRKKIPLVYDGDLLDEDKVCAWLTSQEAFEIKDEIEEVNRKMLEKLLGENDFVAVYFYQNDCFRCDEVLAQLENIDDDADSLDITFVKIRDTRYAKKYGLTKLPALAYFRKRFPSIYRVDD